MVILPSIEMEVVYSVSSTGIDHFNPKSRCKPCFVVNATSGIVEFLCEISHYEQRTPDFCDYRIIYLA